MIYEDHLNDPFLAAYHYRQFLNQTQDDTQKKLVREWLVRTEKRLRDELLNKHPLVPPPDPIPIAPPGGPIPPPATTTALPSRPNQPRPSVASTPAPQPPPPPSAQQTFTTYVVQSGDNLSRIAKKTLGSENKWQIIYEANRDTLPSPGQLKIGQQLRIPKQ
jgi:nucleoid-associated protein YgaU